ncbi:T9SS type A sorting domain-containing protein [bacterium]|nr:T9SS type A sorting domain-containing protein [bacterium]
MRYLSFFLIIFLFIPFSTAFCQDIEQIGELYNHWSGATPIYIDGDFTYLLDQRGGFRIFDTTNPNLPHEIGYFRESQSTESFVILNSYAYLIDSRDEFRVVDIHDPANLEQTYFEEGFESDFLDIQNIENSIVIVTENELLHYSLDNPASPALVATTEIVDIGEVCIFENLVFVYQNDRINVEHNLIVVDFSNPAEPEIIENVDLPGGIATMTTFNDEYLLLSMSYDMIKVMDISDPTDINLVSQFEIDFTCRQLLQISEDIVYHLDSHDDIYVYDFSDIMNPELIDSFEMDSPEYLDKADNILAVATFSDGFYLLDITDPGDRNEIAHVQSDPGSISEVRIRGNFAYVMDKHSGFRIVDISDQENMIEVGFYEMDFDGINFDLLNEYVFIANYGEGVYILDISDPTNIEFVSRLNDPELNAQSTFASGNLLYVAASLSLIIYDISDIQNIEILSSTPCAAGNYVDVQDEIAYVARYLRGYEIFDVSDPEAPQSLYQTITSGCGHSINVRDNILFLCDGPDGLKTYEVTDPSSPELLQLYDNDIRHISKIQLVGNNAFTVGFPGDGIQVFDISDPADIHTIARHQTNYSCEGVAVRGNLAFVGATDQLLAFDCAGALNWEDDMTVQWIPLQGNYFELISLPLTPATDIVEHVFGEIDELTIAYRDNGNIFIPREINTFENMSVKTGYRVYCENQSEANIVGTPLDPLEEFTITGNRWNWIGYPLPQPTPVEIALEEIAEVVTIVMTDDGRFWLPGQGINTIGNMQPGEGYMVFSTEDLTFQFAPDLVAGGNRDEALAEIGCMNSEAFQPTGLPYLVMVNLSEEVKDQNPARIDLFDGDKLVGSSFVHERNSLIPVIAWEGSPDHNLPGFTSGNTISARALNEEGQIIGALESASFSSSIFGEGPYAIIAVSAVDNHSELPLEFSLGKAYPNPFNPVIAVPFTIPVSSDVTLVIYNIVGREIYSKTSHFEAGRHSFIFDASQQGSAMTSGVYFLRMQSKDNTHTQKIMLLK